jgi:hypothetical protein
VWTTLVTSIGPEQFGHSGAEKPRDGVGLILFCIAAALRRIKPSGLMKFSGLGAAVDSNMRTLCRPVKRCYVPLGVAVSVLVTKHYDKLFSVVVSDSTDRPADLIAAVKQCPIHSIKALYIAPCFQTAAWRQALCTIAPQLVPGLAVHHYQAPMGDIILATPPPAGFVPVPYPNIATAATTPYTTKEQIKVFSGLLTELQQIHIRTQGDRVGIVLEVQGTIRQISVKMDDVLKR